MKHFLTAIILFIGLIVQGQITTGKFGGAYEEIPDGGLQQLMEAGKLVI